ncbi:MAG: TetR/AcrR family transcriptional regulator, partial [Aeromicrobium sp.]
MVTTKDTVVEAVSRIIERRESDLPGVAEIAREAGVSRPTFYAYFATSDEAFAQVVAHVRDAVLSIQERADTSSVAATYRSTLVAMLDLTVEHLGLVTLLASQARRDPQIAAMWHDIHDRPVRRHARFIDRLVEQGLAEPAVPSLTIAEAVDGMTARFAQLIAEDPARRDDLAAELVAAQHRLVGLLPTGD